MRAIELAALAERGLWWTAGGLAEQPAQYVAAIRRAGDEMAHWKRAAQRGGDQ